MKKKCLVLFSGGLDSRLVVKIMQEQGFNVLALFFKLPFGCGGEFSKNNLKFARKNKFKLKIIDCTKGELLDAYMKIIQKASHGRGKGINPCKDCKIFLLKEAKKFVAKKKIDLIVNGDVMDERPMSQTKKSLVLIESKSGLKGKLLRPLSAKLLPETVAEKKGFVNRNMLFGIQGRQRIKQMELAERFGISYPTPSGGCLLCDKNLKNRFSKLLDRKLGREEVILMKLGRHFLIDRCWVVLGRNENENKIIKKIRKGRKISPRGPYPTAIILDKVSKDLKGLIDELVFAYSRHGSLSARKEFEKFRI